METGENGLLHIVGKAVLSWLPGSTVDAASKRMSRDFWMPDNSSRYCYECDSQFTIFNRRHHCRICGRVFCGKCTLNTIPLEERVNEDGEKVRVCNFCFKGRQQDNPNLSSVSPSLTPTSSSKSSMFSGSSGGMASPSAASRTSVSNQSQPVSSDTIDYYQSNRLRVRTIRDTSPSPVSPVPSYGDGSYSFRGRSDDEENDQKDQHGCNRDLPCHGPEYYEDDSGTETDIADSMPKHRCNSRNSMNANEDDNAGDLMDSRNIYGGGMTDPLLSRSSRSSEDNNLDDGADEGNLDPVYQAALKEAEQPVDYENNHLIWIPPAPDVEDENAGIEDDEDDEDDVPWALPRSSGSMSSSDHKNRERAASEEHRRAMRAVVDGHFRALVAQLLKSEDVQVGDEDDKESWLEIVTSLALQVAGIVKPDQTGKGGGMDPGGYVKVKCIATGHPIDSMVVKGVVCRKNVAHRRMITKFKNPRLLLLGGSLEYQRVSNQLSSLETLLQQELDHLNMAVARIEAHHPNVLLVEKAVAGHAQTKLLSKEISLVLNVKKPLMDRIARCTGAQIVPSSDNLMNPPKTGHCELFHVETFVEEHGSAGQGGKQLKKTLMFFEGCPKPFGCTILLKGASGDELKKVKRAMQYAVFAAYHLALETSFLADEGASLPDLQSPIVVTLPSKQLASERSITSIPGFTLASHSMNKIESKPASIDTVSDEVLPGLSTSGGNKILNSQGNILLARENTVQSSAPNENVLTRSVSLKNGSLTGETKQVNQNPQYGSASPHTTDEASFLKSEGTEDLSYSLDADQVRQASESKTSVPEAEREDDGEKTLGKEDFPPTPSDHQSILVSFSSRCLSKGTICRQPQIVRIKYYGNSDKPLGRYLRETLFDNVQCRTCEEPAHKHIYCCTHRLGSLTISVRHLDKVHILPGDKEGKIWMWHRCLKCARKDGVPPATSRIVMSDAAWGLSFGKFLELSFSDHAAASRVAACGHLLHRDCLRFYGFGDMIACFRYAPINLHTVRLPPAKLEFNDPNQQDWLRKEASEVAATGELVFAEVLNELRVVGENISNSASWTGKASDARKRIVEFEALLQKEKAEFEEALEKAAPTRCEAGQPIADVLELNRLRRELVCRSVQWDKRLHFLSQMVQKANSVGEHAKFSFKYSDAESGFLKPRGGSDITEGLDSPRLDKVGDNDTAMAIAEGGKCDVDMNGFGQSETTEDGAPKLGTDLEAVSSTAAGPVQDSNTEDVSSLGEQECALSLPDPSRNELSEGRGSLLTASSVQRFPELVNVNDIGGGICRTMSDGNYPIVADLSVTPWIEEDHGIDIQITPVEEVIASKQGDANHEATECVFHEVKDSVDITKSELPSAVDDIPNAICVVDDNAHFSLEKSDNEVEPLLNAPSLAKLTDGSDDLGNWIGAPFSTLYRGYSKGSFGNLPSSPPKSDTRMPVSASPIISRVGQVAIQGGAKVLLPGVDDTVVIVYDDEPTSIIAYAILTHEYQAHVSGVPLDKEKQRDREKEKERDQKETANVNGSLVHPLQSPDGTENEASSKEKVLLKENSFIIDNDDLLLSNKGSNVKIDFSDENLEGKIRYSVTAYYAKHFSALRKKCCAGELEFVRSLSRCRKWGAQGGKSNVFFAKTLDDRFIIKQVTRTELHSFLQFAPEYFKYLSESINTGSPTCLAKILGMFQVTVRQSKGGKEVSMDLMVMENLLFGRHLTRVYDLKGSLRSRYNADLTGQNTVLLDQNLLEAMPTAPIFVGNKAKRLLERAVWNDTSFLASVDVMDYSLLVGVDEQRQELVLGIIDFMRQYTWDKHLETWVKQSGILGGPKNAPPTVISPKQYKKRFRKAMTTYFVTVPDQWTPPSIITAPSVGKGLEDASSSNPQDDSSLSLKAQ